MYGSEKKISRMRAMTQAFHPSIRRTKRAAAAHWTLLCRRALLPGALALAIGACPPSPAMAQNESAGQAEGAEMPAAARKAGEKDRTEDVQRAVERIFDDPLGGVVVNRTVTVLGKDFY